MHEAALWQATEVRALIEKLVRQPEGFGRFLNTLSFLEYIGARKILKSQRQDALTSEILAHVSEELQHAQLLKRASLKLAPTQCETYQMSALLCGSAAGHYFQEVDGLAEKLFGERDARVCYLYTTLLVEERANVLYPMIDEVLGSLGQKPLFLSILGQERRHLEEMTRSLLEIPNSAERLPKLRKKESEAFAIFAEELSKL